jgi:hypothetical protein
MGDSSIGGRASKNGVGAGRGARMTAGAIIGACEPPPRPQRT